MTIHIRPSFAVFVSRLDLTSSWTRSDRWQRPLRIQRLKFFVAASWIRCPFLQPLLASFVAAQPQIHTLSSRSSWSPSLNRRRPCSCTVRLCSLRLPSPVFFRSGCSAWLLFYLGVFKSASLYSQIQIWDTTPCSDFDFPLLFKKESSHRMRKNCVFYLLSSPLLVLFRSEWFSIVVIACNPDFRCCSATSACVNACTLCLLFSQIAAGSPYQEPLPFAIVVMWCICCTE